MKVSEALEGLFQALKSELEDAKSTGARAFEAGEFDSAQSAAEKGAAIGAILESAQQIRDQWQAYQEDSAPPIDPIPVVSKEPEKKKPKSGTSEESFFIPILSALEGMGGKASAEDVLDQVELIVSGELAPSEFVAVDGGEPRWRNTAYSASMLMVRKGLLHTSASKDEWQITPKGRLYFLESSS
jgi:hypothetical protein